MADNVEKPVKGPKEGNAWAPLHNPVFRALWMANAVSNIGTWMQNTAVAWLMATIAPSALLVSLVQTAASFPIFLLALPAGALADVVDRRRILILTQTWMLISAAALGVLTLFNLITPAVLLLLMLSLGIGTALNGPAWQAIIPELVPREQIRPAVAMNSAGFNLARALGPPLGGLVFVAVGAGVTFMINAASFLAVIGVLVWWKRAPRESALPAERVFAAVRTGIRYVRYSHALQAVFIRTLCFIVCASSLMALLPLWAKNYLKVGSGGYGILLGFFGLGAVSGATFLPWVLQKISLDRLINFTVIIFAVSLSLVALVPVFLVDGVAIFLCGASWLALLSNFNATIQSIAPAWVRGRCLAVYMLVFFGGMAAGSFLWGAIASLVGIPLAMYCAAAGLVIGLLATSRLRMVSGVLDQTPAMRSQPAVIFEPQPEQGPVMVTVDYRIDPGDWREFGLALRKLKRARLRGGAFRWAVFVDLAEPSLYRETFLVESWLEHLRQHERQTVADREIQRQVRSFHKGENHPVVTHLLARSLPDKKQEQ